MARHIALEHGFIPPEQPAPGSKSITELEYGAALARQRPVLAFLLDRGDPAQPGPLIPAAR